MSEMRGVEICLFPLTRLIAYTIACCYRTSRDTRGVVGDFVLNFGRHGNGAGRGGIWLTSFNRPPTRRKRHRDIFYTSGVIACFVPNFVAMATGRCHGNGVGRGRICMASFNSAIPKTLCYTQRSPVYLLYKPSYCRFCPKFRCHGNGGWLWWNLYCVIQ